MAIVHHLKVTTNRPSRQPPPSRKATVSQGLRRGRLTPMNTNYSCPFVVCFGSFSHFFDSLTFVSDFDIRISDFQNDFVEADSSFSSRAALRQPRLCRYTFALWLDARSNGHFD